MQVSLKSNLDQFRKDLKFNTPKAIARASQASINRTAATLRTQARREIADEVQPRRGGQGAIGKLIVIRKATGRGEGSQTANIDFAEMGVPVEATKQASIRKVRGKAGRYRVKVKSQSLVKAFKLGDDSKPLFIRSKGKLKRLYSHTLIQEATKAEVWEKLEARAPGLFIPQFLRLVDIFDGFDKLTNSGGRRR
jgi:hypothetical protein